MPQFNEGNIGTGAPQHGSPPEGYSALAPGENEEIQHDGRCQVPIGVETFADTHSDDTASSCRLHQGQSACDTQTPRCVVRPPEVSDAFLRKLIWGGISLMGTCLTFASPGFPFGKYNISYSDILDTMFKWPGLAFVLAYILLFFTFVHFGKLSHPRTWIVVGQALQLFHFFEEHGLEGLDARRSPFKRFFNTLVREDFFTQASWSPEYFTDFNILLMCLTHGMGLFLFSMWEGPRYGASVATFGISLVDGLMHAILCVSKGFSYIPGTFSAIFLVIPSAAYYFTLVNRHIIRCPENTNPVTGVGVISGCIAGLLLAICILNFLPSIMCILAYIVAVMHAEIRMHHLTKARARPRPAPSC